MDRPITRRHFLGAALGTAGLAGLGPAALAACGSTGAQANPGSASASAAVTIDYWHVNSAALGGSTVKDLVGRFHQQNPRITVQERFQPGLYDGLLKNLQAAIAAGRPPDLAQVGYPYLDYVATNLPVTPVHSLAQRYGDGSFFSQFENSALNAGRVRGKQVAMPYAISSMVAYYNADLLRRSGVDPDHPPTTWDGWRQAAGAVRKVTGKPSLYIGVSSGDTWAMQTLIESNGAQLLSCRQGKPHAGLGGAQAVQAIQFWADMVRDGLALNALRDQGQQAFLNGSLAACFEAISARQGFEKQAPFTLRAAPCPSFGARPRRLAAGGNVLFVFARDEARRRAAWELIKFLESPAALTAWTKGTGYLPPRRGVTDDPRYLGQFLQQNPIEGVAAKEVSLIVPWESFPGANGLDAQNVLFTSVQQAIGGQVPAAEALRDADSKVNELIRRLVRMRREVRLSRRRPTAVVPLLLVLPASACLLVFAAWPVVQVVALSLLRWNLVSPEVAFVGLENYASALTDPATARLALQSLSYVGILLVGTGVVPVGLAILTTAVPGRPAAVYQSLLFVPSVIAISVASLVWQGIYQPEGGPLSASAMHLHLPAPNVLNDPRTALVAVAVAASWKYGGFNYLLTLAGLASLPRGCIEAARVDGAAGFRLLRFVVLPLLAPTVLFVGLTTVLNALSNVLVPTDLLTGGGPAGASSSLLYAVYQQGLRFFHVGLASAETVLVLLALAGAGIWQFRLLDRRLSDAQQPD